MRRRRRLWIILLATPLVLLAADTAGWWTATRYLARGLAELGPCDGPSRRLVDEGLHARESRPQGQAGDHQCRDQKAASDRDLASRGTGLAITNAGHPDSECTSAASLLACTAHIAESKGLPEGLRRFF